MDTTELKKAKAHIIVEIIEYVPNAVVIKTLFQKTTGNITVTSIDSGESITEKIIPYDTYVLIIDGKAEIIIEGESNLLNTGDAIIIPAHTSNIVKGRERFKMLSTIIKNGYD